MIMDELIATNDRLTSELAESQAKLDKERKELGRQIHAYAFDNAHLKVSLGAKTAECALMRATFSPLEMLEYMGKRIKGDALEGYDYRSHRDPAKVWAQKYGCIGAEIEALAKSMRAALGSSVPARGGPERATSAQWPQCSCAEIQAADVSRHFRECLRRAVYPQPPAPKPQPVEPQGPDRCRKGTPACTVDHTGMLGGYSECVAPDRKSVV